MVSGVIVLGLIPYIAFSVHGCALPFGDFQRYYKDNKRITVVIVPIYFDNGTAVMTINYNVVQFYLIILPILFFTTLPQVGRIYGGSIHIIINNNKI